MPAERGKDAARRFAAAVDRGRPPRSTNADGDDQDLARELEIVAMLRSRGAAYAPHPDAKAQAKQRLIALLAEQHAGGAFVDRAPTTAAERTAPLPRISEPPTTTVRPAAEPAPVGEPATAVEVETATDTDTDTAEPTPATPPARRTSHRIGRHTRVSRPAGRARTSSTAPRSDQRRRGGLARRFGLVSSAALLVLVAFTGAGVFVSRDALPGQTLYPFKRAAEAASLAMTFDDEARAQRNLEFATIRLSEIEQLIALSGGSGVDPQLVRAAMIEFDTAASEGSRTLLSDQQGSRNGNIDTLKAWAAKQSARLAALRSALPVPAVPAADTSIALLDQLSGHTASRKDTAADCGKPAAGGDELGSVPTQDCVTRTPGRAGSVGARDESSSRSTGRADGPTSTDSTDEAEQNGLSPINPDRGPLNSGPLGDDAAVDQPPTESSTDLDQQQPEQLPLPLPSSTVTLPPLLPGMPPLSSG